MKKIKNIISVLAISSILFEACNGNDKSETRNIQLLTDSTAYHNNTFGDTSRLVGSENNPANNNGNSNNSHSNSGVINSGNSNSGSAGSNGTGTQQANGKKGWSKAAQGAVIGGAAGAVGGAIISKKKGTGAAIGAAVGAASGYIIGRDKDKKDGRVNKDKQ